MSGKKRDIISIRMRQIVLKKKKKKESQRGFVWSMDFLNFKQKFMNKCFGPKVYYFLTCNNNLFSIVKPS